MTSAELKASILDRAVRGLLTATWRTTHPSRPSSPASRPSSPIPDPPFPIPDSWEWVRLGDIATKLTDGTHKTPTYSSRGVHFVSVKDMSTGKLDLSNTKFITQEEHDKLFQRCDPEIGDLLISKVGTTGIPAIVDTTTPFSLFVSVALMKFPHHLVDAKFLYYAIYSPHVQLQAKKNTKGEGNKNWVLDLIRLTTIPLPPLAEQREIVAKIEELMPLVEEYGKAETLLAQLNDNFPTALRKSILQHAVEGRLTATWRASNTHHSSLVTHHSHPSPVSRPSPIDNPPFPIPDSWEWVRLGEVVNLLNGDRGANYPSKDKLHPDGDIPFISAVNMKDGSVSKDQLLYLSTSQYEKLRAGKLQRNDVVLCIRGSLGKHCIYPFDSGAIASSLVILRTGNYINRKYLSFYIDAPLFGKEIIKYDNGTAQPNLAATNAAKFLLPLPPLAEQREIVARVEELLKLVEEMK